jgi:phage/plasmid-associated DNA primase
VLLDALDDEEGADHEEIDKRIEEMCRPFENRTSSKFVEGACADFLSTRIKTTIRDSAIPFRDVVLIFEQGKLFQRRAYMEDQFPGVAPVYVKGFGHTEREKGFVQDVRDLLYKMFVYKENVDWNIRWMGSLLAHRPERVCSIWYGPKGGNAKTTLAKILVWIFGEYAVQCRPDILIANKNGGQSCTPFEAELQGRVLAVISEPQKTQVYSSSTLKDMTGSDLKIAARKYKDPVQFEQTAKPVILSNHIPQFDDQGQALTDRLFISHCYGRFTQDAPESIEDQRKEHHYPADNEFWTDERKQALAWLIIHEGFPAYIKEGLEKTSYQRKELVEYLSQNNDFVSFSGACEHLYNGKLHMTSALSVFDIFKTKFRRKYDSMNFNTFLSEFRKSTGFKTKEFQDQTWFLFSHPACPDRREIPDDI